MGDRRRLLATILLSTTIFGVATPVLAQDAKAGTAETTARGAPQPQATPIGTPTGQTAEVDEGTIVVTARRVEENLQDVPISISVFSQQQIANRNIVIASDLATYTPSLSINQRFGPEKSSFSIRGFNQEVSTAPTVGVYFADVVGVRAQGGTTSGNTVGAGSFMDLANVQVLKGPQGTLFGRNTTGGAILLVPNRPNSRFGGWLEGQAGDYGLRRVMGVVNVPVADWLKVRASFDRNTRDGYLRNRSGIGPKTFNDVDYWAARFSVLADLTPNLENYTIFTYSNSDTNGTSSKLAVCDPNAAAQSVRSITAFAACDALARQRARGDGYFDVDSSNPDPYLKIKTWQVINTTTWQASDTLTVKNIASYGQFHELARFNLYGDNFFISSRTPSINVGVTIPLRAGAPFRYIDFDRSPGEDASAQSTVTEELQLQGRSADSKLTYTIGGYLEFSRPLGFSTGRTGIYLNCDSVANVVCQAPVPAVGGISNSRTKFDFDNHGIFAQGTYNFTDQLALTLGGRYTFDKIKGLGQSTRFLIAGNGSYAGQFCNDTLRFFTPGSNPRRLIVQSVDQCNYRITEKSNKPTWLVDVDYKPTQDTLLYAKYSRGYRQGGISFTNVGLETWSPESIDAYEVGAKLSFLKELHGFFNVAAFYNDLRDQQLFGLTVAIPGPGQQAGGQVIVNAGRSRVQGIEADAGITPITGLRFDLGYAYLDTKLKRLSPVSPPPGTPFQAVLVSAVAGGPLPLVPKHRLSFSANYRLPIDEATGNVTLGGTFVYTSRQFSTTNTVPGLQYLPPSHLLNFNVNWDHVAGSPIDAAFFMTNVTNEKYNVNVGQGYTSGGFDTILPGMPRMFGFRLRVNFGA